MYPHISNIQTVCKIISFNFFWITSIMKARNAIHSWLSEVERQASGAFYVYFFISFDRRRAPLELCWNILFMPPTTSPLNVQPSTFSRRAGDVIIGMLVTRLGPTFSDTLSASQTTGVCNHPFWHSGDLNLTLPRSTLWDVAVDEPTSTTWAALYLPSFRHIFLRVYTCKQNESNNEIRTRGISQLFGMYVS